MSKVAATKTKKLILKRFANGTYESPGAFLLKRFEVLIKGMLQTNRNLPDFYLYTVWCLFTLLIGLLVSLLLREQALWSWDLLIAEIFMILVSSFLLIASKWFFVDFKENFVPRILESTSNEANLLEFIKWANRGYVLHRIAFPLFLIWILLISNTPDVNLVPVATTSYGSFVIMAIVSVPSSIGVFLLLWGISVPLKLKGFDFFLYESNPARSSIVQFMLERFSNYAVYVAVINSIITLVYVILESVSFQNRILLILAAWLPLTLFFASIHWSLYVVIKRHKRKALFRLEKAASQITKRVDSKSLQRVRHINDQYQAILKAPNSALNLASAARLLGAMLLQLPSLLLSFVK